MKKNEKITVKDRQLFAKSLKEKLETCPIETVAKSLAASVFRNGLIEDFHVSYHISNEDMKRLNKDVVNRIATMLRWWKEEKYASIHRQLQFGNLCTKNWDDPETVDDMPECEEEFDEMLLACKEKKIFGFEDKKQIASIPNEKKCFTLSEDELKNIFIELTGNIDMSFSVYSIEGDLCIEVEEPTLFEEFDPCEIVGQYYGVDVIGIHYYCDADDTTFRDWWIEYR